VLTGRSQKVLLALLPGNEVIDWLTSESLLALVFGDSQSPLGSQGHWARELGR
jgi:hypothetical protein